MWLSGRTENRLIFKGANQLVISHEAEQTLKKIIKFVQRRQENKNLKLTNSDALTDDMLDELYDVFLDKIKNTVYKIRLSAQIKTLVDKKKTFLSLCKEDKSMVLLEILHMFQCQSNTANLKLIGGPGDAGSIKISKNISKNNKIIIINQSSTGIYEQEIDLLKL